MDVLISKLQSDPPLAIAFCVAAFSVLATWYSFYFQYRVWNWASVWGTMIKGEVGSVGGSSSSNRTYLAQVEYNYCIDGKEYTGTRLSAMAVMSSSPGLLQKQLRGAEISDDGQVKVYFDRTKPSKSYLIRGSKTQVVFTFLYFLVALALTVHCARRLHLM